MKTIVISITVPDGVEFRVSQGPPPDDFEHEPLPVETFAADESYVPNGHAQEPTSLRRDTMAPVAVAPAPIWQEGAVHAQGHKPLKKNSRGLFCPTAVGKDAAGKTLFCQWRP